MLVGRKNQELLQSKNNGLITGCEIKYGQSRTPKLKVQSDQE
jgi:hypothetical protein